MPGDDEAVPICESAVSEWHRIKMLFIEFIAKKNLSKCMLVRVIYGAATPRNVAPNLTFCDVVKKSINNWPVLYQCTVHLT